MENGLKFKEESTTSSTVVLGNEYSLLTSSHPTTSRSFKFNPLTFWSLSHSQDFGQKKFGNVVCPECDMVYNHHEEQDRKQHEKFHNKWDLMAFPVS